MKNELFLSSPENRAAVKIISQRVLAEVEPDELGKAARFIEPLMDMAARDEVVVRDPAHQAGGFGSADLIVSVVIPTIVTALVNLLRQLETARMEAANKKKMESEVNQLIKAEVEQAMEEMLRRTRSMKAKRKSKALKRAVIAEITRHLQNMGPVNIALGDQVNITRFAGGIETGAVQTATGDQVNVTRPIQSEGGSLNDRP